MRLRGALTRFAVVVRPEEPPKASRDASMKRKKKWSRRRSPNGIPVAEGFVIAITATPNMFGQC